MIGRLAGDVKHNTLRCCVAAVVLPLLFYTNGAGGVSASLVVVVVNTTLALIFCFKRSFSAIEHNLSQTCAHTDTIFMTIVTHRTTVYTHNLRTLTHTERQARTCTEGMPSRKRVHKKLRSAALSADFSSNTFLHFTFPRSLALSLSLPRSLTFTYSLSFSH